MYNLRFTQVSSVAIIASVFALLNPTLDSLSGVSSVFGYGAGLAVDNVTVLNGTAAANDTYTNGFKFKMRVTIDSPSENGLRLRFNDWSKVGGGGSILTTGNMKVDLASLTDPSGALGASTIYGSPLLVSGDVDTGAQGIQQDVYIWLKVPVSTVGGAYSTAYGIQSTVVAP